MNAEVEQALETYLTAQLAAITPLAVHAGTKRADLPQDRRTLVIAVRDCQRIPTQAPLYNAIGTLAMSTPVIKTMAVAMHMEMVKAARWAVKPVVDDDHDQAAVDAAKAALDAAVLAATGMHCRSTWLEGPKEAHTAQDWQTLSDVSLLLTTD